MSTPFRECPACGAHLDAGERCDCTDTAAAERAGAKEARITPPERAYYGRTIGVDGRPISTTAAGRVPAESW